MIFIYRARLILKGFDLVQHDLAQPGHAKRHAGLVESFLTRCNVTDLRSAQLLSFGGEWNTLDVTYRDPDGSAVENQVTVELHRTSDAEELVSVGKQRAVPRDDFVIATVNSNDHVETGRATVSQLFSHPFDFVNNAYYVTIKVKRPSSGTPINPAAFIVRLYHSSVIGG